MAAPGSTLMFLHQVSSYPANTKVRFLGCVTSYDTPTAILTLAHPPAPGVVLVDISVLANTLSMGAIRNGEWINIIGYTTDGGVQAIVMWSAQGVDLGVYEKVLKERLEVEAGG